MIEFLAISTLDELARYWGYPDYGAMKGLIYPTPLYRTFEIPKRSGGKRVIETPARKLKEMQRKLSRDITDCFGKRSRSAHAFIKNRSVITNAWPHVRRASVVRVDLEDFFHQINFGRVKGVFRGEPFNFPNEVATVLAHTCCCNNRLPQGAPTSPPLSNFICLALDRNLLKLAIRFKGRYTRYADDLTFSFKTRAVEELPANLFTAKTDEKGRNLLQAGPLLEAAVSKQGFKINATKTRGTNRIKRQMVTGIVVNDGLSVPRRHVDRIRRALHIWRVFGLAEAEKRALPVLHSKSYASGLTPSLIRVLRGKLAWLASVTGRSGSQYQKLGASYNALVSREGNGDPHVHIEAEVRNIQDATKATWYLEAETGAGSYDCRAGTAFRYAEKVWVTCAHCVGDLRAKTVYSEIRLFSSDWVIVELPVRVVSVDWDRDLALLRPLPMRPIPRHLAYFSPSKTKLTPESRVAVLGFPSSNLYQPPIFMRARVVRVRAISSVDYVEIDKQIISGNSSGPMFNEDYQVVGIVVEGAKLKSGMNAGIAISELRFLPGI